MLPTDNRQVFPSANLSACLPGSFLRVFLVALEQLDRDALRAADEADPDSRPNGRRLLRELDALGLDLGGHRVDVFYRQPEMIEPLIGRLRRRVNAVAGRNRRDEHVGAAELDVDPPGATDDHAAEDIFKPGRRRLWIRTAQMDLIPTALCVPIFVVFGCNHFGFHGLTDRGGTAQSPVAAWL